MQHPSPIPPTRGHALASRVQAILAVTAAAYGLTAPDPTAPEAREPRPRRPAPAPETHRTERALETTG